MRTILALRRLKEVLNANLVHGKHLIDETKLDIERVLKEFRIAYNCHFLSDHTSVSPDFFLPDSGIVLVIASIKDWKEKQVLRQCQRYCMDARVKGVFLGFDQFKGRSTRLMGKPVQAFQLTKILKKGCL